MSLRAENEAYRRRSRARDEPWIVAIELMDGCNRYVIRLSLCTGNVAYAADRVHGFHDVGALVRNQKLGSLMSEQRMATLYF